MKTPGWQSPRCAKIRCAPFLTVLGVVIGITALLAVVSILLGVYKDVNAVCRITAPTRYIFRFDPGINGTLNL